VQFGADAQKIRIIPNGVEASLFQPIRAQWQAHKQQNPERCVVGFLGRVVPIKDVKTLLKAAALVHAQRPAVRFLLAGPTDEDPRYFAECEEIVTRQNLGGVVSFPGSMKLADFLPQVDMVVLSSLSEGLPFSVLEAFGAHLPMITTDVGSCRELLEGRPGENPPLGTGGLVVPVGDAERLADAIIHLADHPEQALAMGANGYRRTITHYVQGDVVRQFDQLYQAIMTHGLVA
jgi:polysaccharide biosynthesis protein PelF